MPHGLPTVSPRSPHDLMEERAARTERARARGRGVVDTHRLVFKGKRCPEGPEGRCAVVRNRPEVLPGRPNSARFRPPTERRVFAPVHGVP